MNTTRLRVFLSAVAAISILGAAWLVAAQSVASRWKAKEINVDGAISKWPELTSFTEGVSVAAVNDERDLYLAIATSDSQRRRQLTAAGLIIWLDPGGGKKEIYGIQIPGGGFQLPAGRFGDVPDDTRISRPPAITAPKLTYVELLGPHKDDRRRLELAAESEIVAAAGMNEGTLLYELKLPLAVPSAGQPYGIGAKVDRPLGLGLQTPKLERPQGGGPRGGGTGGRGRGGFGGGGRGGGGAGGGGMRGRGPLQMQELKLWTTLTLARVPR